MSTQVAACIGVALGLLDYWLSGTDPDAPDHLGQRVHLPAGHWRGERAATDILVLARKGRAFSSPAPSPSQPPDLGRQRQHADPYFPKGTDLRVHPPRTAGRGRR